MLGFFPGVSCLTGVADVLVDVAKRVQGTDVLGWGNYMSWGLDALACALPAGGGLAKATIKAGALNFAGNVRQSGSSFAGIIGGASTLNDCYLWLTSPKLEQRAVLAIDPNDLVGPGGSGSARYISGAETLNYEVLFENLASATAPAQRIAITDQLDTALYDPSTVLFQSVQFGSTVYSLPYSESARPNDRFATRAKPSRPRDCSGDGRRPGALGAAIN